MKITVIGAVVATLLGTPVLAADLAVKAPPPAPAPVYSWTGFYVGGSVGGRWTDADWTTTCLYTPFSANNCPLNGLDPNRLATRNPQSFDSSAVRGGVYAGYNWQFDPRWVAGVEADAGWADNRKSVNNGIPGTLQAVFVDNDIAEVKQTWDAGLRGRIGYLINPGLMVFGAGGVSWTRLQATTTCGPIPLTWCSVGGGGLSASTSMTKVGWTVGGGLEWMLAQRWLLRGEYRYADYGKATVNLLADPAGRDGLLADINVHTHTALFGVAYKFSGP
ncbi:outer membrane protein [Bradyrhizobium arachidis]|uniref:outer membrane protein n=1 Tax=Bradyrhizobium arachidis TaxID=858423 RepID=UPI002162AE65|nr:outer membrane protein [Bradyrhizobium arachidis]UVO29433.1 porin family protein [Bradyrhizobium arachidis]